MDRHEAQYFIKKNFKWIMTVYENHIKATINTGSVEDVFDIAEDILFMKEFRKNGWDINSIYLEDVDDIEKAYDKGE